VLLSTGMTAFILFFKALLFLHPFFLGELLELNG
jgi:hypothetical protein